MCNRKGYHHLYNIFVDRDIDSCTCFSENLQALILTKPILIVLIMCRYTYVSIDEAINDLQARGFSKDFFLLDDRLFCRQQNKTLRNREFDILETHYFPRDE